MKSTVYSITFITALLFGSFTLQSCKKEGCTDEAATNYDEEAKKDDDSCEYADEITFTITTPAEGSTYGKDETVHISAMIESTGELHGYEVVIRNVSNDNEEVFRHSESETHESMIHIHQEWVNTVASHSDMEMEVIAIIDHEGNTESEHTHFHCHPM